MTADDTDKSAAESRPTAPEEVGEPQPAEQQGPEKASAQASDPVRRLTLVVLAVCVFLFVWYIFAARMAPWTDQARVQGFVIPIAPKVSGKVIKMELVPEQIVEAGDLLLQIDPRDYELAVQKAEAALELAGQDVGASTDAVAAAEANLVETQTQLEYYQQQAQRYLTLAKKGVISEAQADQTRAEVDKAKARVRSATAELDKAKEQLGREGQDNPRIRDAIAALNKARRDLAATSVTAPTDGGITNLQVKEGYWANAGQPVMTFASATDVWVQASLRENSIYHVKIGDAVEIALDIAPGRIFPGTVAAIGFAVKQAGGGAVGEAATVENRSGWLRDAQRFPVIIRFADDSAYGLRRHGAQADVQIYTQNSNWVLNGLGWAWIRLMSVLSYVY